MKFGTDFFPETFYLFYSIFSFKISLLLIFIACMYISNSSMCNKFEIFYINS